MLYITPCCKTCPTLLNPKQCYWHCCTSHLVVKLVQPGDSLVTSKKKVDLFRFYTRNPHYFRRIWFFFCFWFLGAFTKLRKETTGSIISVYPSSRPSARNKTSCTEPIIMKTDIESNLGSRKPRIMNSSVYIKFSEHKASRMTYCVSSYEHASRQHRGAISWQYQYFTSSPLSTYAVNSPPYKYGKTKLSSRLYLICLVLCLSFL